MVAGRGGVDVKRRKAGLRMKIDWGRESGMK
jgi:hypothetical protein